MSMYLTRVLIKNMINFKKMIDIEIYDDLLYIVGENGSGKTNIIRIINLVINNIMSGNIKNYEVGMWDPLNKSTVRLFFRPDDEMKKKLIQIFILQLVSDIFDSRTNLFSDNSSYYYLFDKLENLFIQHNIFDQLVVSIERDPVNIEKMNYFISFISDNCELILNFIQPSRFFIGKSQSIMEQSRDTDSIINNIDNFLVKMDYLDELYNKFDISNSDNDLTDNQHINNLEEIFCKIITNDSDVPNLKMNFKQLDQNIIERIGEISDFNEIILSLKRYFRSIYNRYDNGSYSVDIKHIIYHELERNIEILVEDRGLITSANQYDFIKGFHSNLVLSNCIQGLMDMKISSNYETRKRYERIQQHFLEIFDVRFDVTFHYMLKDAQIEINKVPTLIYDPQENKKYFDYVIETVNSGKFYGAFTNLLFIISDELQITLKQAPGGYIEGVMVLYALFNSNSKTIILDEPGNRFHKNYMIKLKDIIFSNRREFKKSMIVITHSKELISEESMKHTIRVIGGKQGSAIKNIRDYFDSITDRSKVSKHITGMVQPVFRDLFFEKHIIFVEGKWDTRVIDAINYLLENKIIQKYLEYGKIKYTLIQCDGKDTVEKGVRLCEFLGIEWYILFDYDAIEEENIKKDQTVWKILQMLGIPDLDKSVLSDNIDADQDEILQFCAEKNIFCWRKDLENAFNTCKRELREYLFENIISKIETEISDNNPEIDRFFSFLIKKNLLRKRSSVS